MNALKAVFLLLLIIFGLAYGSAMMSLLETSWILFALAAVSVPLGLAWMVGDEADRADFYKIRDWITGREKRTQKPPQAPPELDGQSKQ